MTTGLFFVFLGAGVFVFRLVRMFIYRSGRT
jgi:hypothetical protein